MLRYHERLQACLDGHLSTDISLPIACAALEVRYQDARAVLKGGPIDEIVDPAEADCRFVTHENRAPLNYSCGAHELIQDTAPPCAAIPVYSPYAAPDKMHINEWQMTGYTAAVSENNTVTVGIQLPHAVEGWGFPQKALLICTDRLMPVCWLRLDRGWTIARAATRGRWSDASGRGHYPRGIVKWWMGIMGVGTLSCDPECPTAK